MPTSGFHPPRPVFHHAAACTWTATHPAHRPGMSVSLTGRASGWQLAWARAGLGQSLPETQAAQGAPQGLGWLCLRCMWPRHWGSNSPRVVVPPHGSPACAQLWVLSWAHAPTRGLTSRPSTGPSPGWFQMPGGRHAHCLGQWEGPGCNAQPCLSSQKSCCWFLLHPGRSWTASTIYLFGNTVEVSRQVPLPKGR